ncbi:MAG: DUF7288 family protein [Candidatus Syntropharchaeia archaeon]
MIKDEKAQTYTIEALVAVMLVLGAVVYVLQSPSVTVQTENSIDVQLKLYGEDALNVLDMENMSGKNVIEKCNTTLKKWVIEWNGSEANEPGSITLSGFNITNFTITRMLPEHIKYNMNFTYINGSSLESKRVIYMGKPPEDSVSVSQLVTLNGEASSIPDISSSTVFQNIVEVRLILWYI